MPAWVAHRLVAQCGMDATPSASLVSPMCLEGRGSYLSMMTLLAGTNEPLTPLTVHHGAGNRWYANVPLSPDAPTQISVSYQNGGLTETNAMTWQILNLLDPNKATNVVIRKGDSLLLSAFPEGATETPLAARITAIQICAERGIVQALPEIERFAEAHGQTALQLSAIAALGKLGKTQDTALLERLESRGDVALRPALVAALKRLTPKLASRGSF
jgi:hypothetical protein